METPELAPTALITISGGKLEASVVQQELSRLIRADWNWEALPHGDDAFLVTFPSEEELRRWDDLEFRLKNHGVVLNIAEWKENVQASPSYELDVVWVHVTGVPHNWRHYPGFWAIGSAIGVTQEVDMYTFRKKGVIRIQVGIMNRDLLPYTTDLVFGVEGFHLTFALEPEGFEVVATPNHPPPPPHMIRLIRIVTRVQLRVNIKKTHLSKIRSPRQRIRQMPLRVLLAPLQVLVRCSYRLLHLARGLYLPSVYFSARQTGNSKLLLHHSLRVLNQGRVYRIVLLLNV